VTIPLNTVVAKADGTGSATTRLKDVTLDQLLGVDKHRFILLHDKAKKGQGGPSWHLLRRSPSIIYWHFLREPAFKRWIAARSVAYYPADAASRGHKHRTLAAALRRLAYLAISVLELAHHARKRMYRWVFVGQGNVRTGGPETFGHARVCAL
jgi:hypothetical protein